MYSIHKTKRYVADCEFFKKHDQLAFRKIQYLERIIEIKYPAKVENIGKEGCQWGF